MTEHELQKKIFEENVLLKEKLKQAKADIPHICGKCYYSYHSMICPVEQEEKVSGTKLPRNHKCEKWEWYKETDIERVL